MFWPHDLNKALMQGTDQVTQRLAYQPKLWLGIDENVFEFAMGLVGGDGLHPSESPSTSLTNAGEIINALDISF